MSIAVLPALARAASSRRRHEVIRGRRLVGEAMFAVGCALSAEPGVQTQIPGLVAARDRQVPVRSSQGDGN